MEKKKIVLTLCKVFPVTNSQAGQPTGFEDKLKAGVKKHTIRANENGIWDKRVKAIQDGQKVLCVREWTGKPYNSEQREFARFEKIGIQHIEIFAGATPEQCKVDGKVVPMAEVAANDGLTLEQFKEWFFGDGGTYFKGAIIHFTDFRY